MVETSDRAPAALPAAAASLPARRMAPPGRRPQLIVVLLGLLALGIIWLGLSFHLGLREKVAGDIARRDAANLAIALEEQVQRTFSGIDQLLLLAKAEAEEDLARFSLAKWVARAPFLDELALEAAIADARGAIRETSPAGAAREPASVADREPFRIHAERPDAGLFIGRPAADPATGRRSMQLSRRLNDPSGAFAGVLIVSLDPGYLARKFASLNVGSRGSVTLVGRDGYLRARTPDQAGMYERGLREELATSGLALPPGSGEVALARARSPVDGIERVFASRRVGDLPLVVSVGLSTEEMLGPVHRERRRALVLGGAVSIVLCLFILILLTELETRRRGQEDLARANRALAESEARYRLLADNTTDVIARVALDGTLRYLSPACRAVTGFAPEELVGRKSSSLIHPDDRPYVEEHFRRLIAAGPDAPRTSLAFRAMHKDGSWTWIEINPAVLVDPATGAPCEFVDVVRNISRRKEIEAELRQKTSLLEATLEHMDQGLVMIDSHGTVAVSNRRAIELLDLPPDFMASKPSYLEIRRRKVAEGEYSASDQAFQDWIAGGGMVPAQQTYERVRPNGTALEVRTVPLADGGVVRTYSDITYRKRAEQALKRSEARFRLLAENASDIIMLRTLGGRRTYVSPACQAVLGYSPEFFLGIRREDLIHPEDLPRIRAIYEALSPARPTMTDTHRLRHRDGHWIWVEAVFRLTEDDGQPTVLVAIRDVSDRHAQSAELQAAKDRAEILLAQAEQASQAKSDFLASMSHEIRTPLNSILGFTDLLLEDYDLPPEARRLLQQVQGSGTALLTVVNDILDFSKIEAGQIELDPKPTHIASLVDNVISIIRGVAAKKRLELRVSLDPGIPCTVVADGDRLRQVLLNLVNNAVKFTARGHIALSVRHLGSSPAGERIRFEVEDTGIGIPPDKQPRLFERFSQVDSSIGRHFGGTGLGLAICKQLVGLMQGTIGVDSQEGRGSTFWFELTLPLGVLEEDAPAQAPRAAEAAGRPVRILLVEDIDLNQELGRTILEKAGHVVDVAADGAEAVQRVQSHAYDLVLMDIQMPVMDGIAATERIRRLPGEVGTIPIIAMTANVLPAQVSRFRLAGMDDHIGKPFKRDELLAAIRHWGDGRRHGGPPPAGPARPSGFDSRAFSEIIALVDEKRRPALLDKLATQLAGWPDPAAAAAMDREQLAATAHQLVSSAGILGFQELSELCRELETTCRIEAPGADLLADVNTARLSALARITDLRQAG